MENRLKECQGDLFADRTPTPTMRANQLRLWLSSMAYVLLCAIRRIGLAGTKLERATCGTIRLGLLKIGALVTVSVRRVKLAFASTCPNAERERLPTPGYVSKPSRPACTQRSTEQRNIASDRGPHQAPTDCARTPAPPPNPSAIILVS